MLIVNISLAVKAVNIVGAKEGKCMKDFSKQELDAKIQAFMVKKMQEYPEIVSEPKSVYTTVEPSISTRLLQAFSWFKPAVLQ